MMMELFFGTGKLADGGPKNGLVFAFANDKDELALSAALAQLDKDVGGKITAQLTAIGFAGKADSVTTLPASHDGYDNLIVVGLGKAAKADKHSVAKAAAAGIKSALDLSQTNLEALLDGLSADGVAVDEALLATEIGLGVHLTAYRFDQYKSKTKKPASKLAKVAINVSVDEAAALKVAALADGVTTARDLVMTPSNDLPPPIYAKKIAELSSLGLKVTILGEKEMAALGMGSLLGVGQGSVQESQLVVMEWKGGGDEAPLALVGKGVTFDTGGISIKPSGGMEDMKGDMGGSAAVVGAMVALAKRKAKANVVGFVGLVENMPDGNAQRPGDIVTSMSGQTIEVLNTDAEGRLVLCDVMTYAQRTYKPSRLIDLATLTGAIIISLGSEYAGLFSNSDELSAGLTKAGEASGEKLWRLPQAPAYDRLLDSKVADIKNVQRSGGGAGAGSITAAQFLGRFVEEGVQWAHLDIAGTAWATGTTDPRQPVWATGFGVLVLDQFVADNLE